MESYLGFLLAFINSFNNIPVSMFLSGPGITTLPASLMSYVEYNYDPTVSAVSVLLMLATIFIMFIVEKHWVFLPLPSKRRRLCHLIDLKNICVSYDGKTNILEGLNLQIQEGELVSLLGPADVEKQQRFVLLLVILIQKMENFW